MKIRSIDVRLLTTPLHMPFRTRYGQTDKVEHVVVKVETDEGLFGIGEAAPLVDFTGETPQIVEAFIQTVLSHLLVGNSPEDLEDLHQRMERIPGNTSAKAAVDMALYDLAAKSINRPLYMLLGGRFREQVEVAEAVGIGSPREMADQAVKLVELGFRTIKIKVGGHLLEDVERVRSTRDAVGANVNIRVDANGSFSFGEALRFIHRIERYEPQYVEQPLRPDLIAEMAMLRKKISIPLAADESMHNPSDALRIISTGAADVLAVKLVKCGGIHNAKKILTLAEVAQIPCVMISPFEIGIGLAANLHLAYSSKIVESACELAIGTLYDDPFTKGLHIDYPYMSLPNSPGLGVSLHM